MFDVPAISICIPTYNRASYLAETLVSIKKAAENIKYKIEICISDNASEDNTAEVVKKFQKTINESSIQIKYHKNKENLGADKNFLKAVELASAELCWFLGSDDLAIKSSLEQIFDTYRSNKADIFVYDRINFSSKKKELESWTRYPFHVTSQNINDYIEQLDRLGGIFSYISSIVFKKSLWDNVVQIDKQLNRFIGTQYIHTYILFRMISNGADMYYAHKPIVLNRIGNSTFLSGKNHFRRILLDYAYLDIAEATFGTTTKEAIESLLYRKNTLPKLLRAKLFLAEEDQVLYNEFINQKFKRKELICKLTPNFVIKSLLYFYQMVK
ncbi:glycosyltransferase [Hydrogenimonas sp.]|nr:glycosyltransferase [Hydrogenimonas sp.]